MTWKIELENPYLAIFATYYSISKKIIISRPKINKYKIDSVKCLKITIVMLRHAQSASASKSALVRDYLLLLAAGVAAELI